MTRFSALEGQRGYNPAAVTVSTQPVPDALTSAGQTIRDGQSRLDHAAASIAAEFDSGTPDVSNLVGDVLDLSEAARQIKLGVAVARTDQEAGNEIVNMVRHDANASRARDTRPRPTQPQHVIDIMA